MNDLIHLVKTVMTKHQLDATPVDLTTAYVVSVEGRSVDPNFFHQESELGFTFLETLMEDIAFESLQEGHKDLSYIVSSMEEAIQLVDDLNRRLPQASLGWGPSGSFNAYARAVTLEPDGSFYRNCEPSWGYTGCGVWSSHVSGIIPSSYS